MRGTILVLVICLGLALSVLGQDFYDVNTINTVELIFAESNWDDILASYYDAGDEERLTGTAIINGVQFDQVGVRYKGNSSYKSVPGPKKPFNIKLDYVIEDQLLDGYGTLKLANGFKDASMVREALSYEIARQYMPASLANYANLYVNDELMGLYTSVQSVDKAFLDNHFFSDDNAFFKGDILSHTPVSGCPMGPPAVLGYSGTDSACYSNLYELRSDSGFSELIDLCDTLNNFNDDVELVLDVDRLLWMLAFDNLLVSLDAPINIAHNYYIYQDGTGRFNFILWDLNMTMGTFTGLGGPMGTQLSVTELQQLDPFLNIGSSEYPIISMILTNPTYAKMYVAHMKTIMEEMFSSGWYSSRALELQDIIDADIQADANKLFTYAEFLSNVDYSVSGNVGLTELMDARVTFLNSQAEFQYAAPGISNISNSPAIVSAGSSVWINADVSGEDEVSLAYRSGVSNRFTKIQMYDDGSHNDGSAGDGTYGVSVPTGSSDMQYYIYAQNDNAAAFSPERAEYEYYTISVSGSLVINEFMASNSAAHADQDGEYDDWLELYNGGDEGVSLSGYYLTDDPTDLTAWSFPDTAIAAGGFLLLWADEDSDQDGLHTNFKLSASGEAILFVDPSLTVKDEVTFGEQTADISYGRYPDAAESWQFFSTPTPGATNGGSTNIPPEFDWTMFLPVQPAETDSVVVLSQVTDESGLTGVALHYDAGSGSVTVDMFDDGAHHDSLAGDDIYGATIPPQYNATVVRFNVEATDDSLAVTYDPVDPVSDDYSYRVQVASVSLFINEFMADNDSTIADPDGSGGYPDWLEIYNAGESIADLGGMYLSDDLSEPTMWQIPAGVEIDPGGFILFWADNDEDQGDTHTGFKLSADGEAIGLYDTDGNGNWAVDMVVFGAQTTDTSSGRFTDGGSTWKLFSAPTPGYSNEPVVVVGCCIPPTVGDINQSGGVDITDISVMIDNQFLTLTAMVCEEEGDIDFSGLIDITDLSILIDNQFLTLTPLPECP